MQRFDSQLADLAQPNGRARSDKIKYYNNPSYVILAFKKLAGNTRRFKMPMGMSIQEFEFLLAKVEEHGAGSQDQGGHVQQAGRHGGRSGVAQNMQGPCMF